MFVGHQYVVRDFQRLIATQRLAQGYIFFGEPQVGKFYFAKHLAHALENGVFALSEHWIAQDACILESASGIADMRRIQRFLWQKPAVSSHRTVIINDTEQLTPEAQNAILKITEEPPPHGLIILITQQLDSLLSPIISRFQKIYFGRLSEPEMMQLEKSERVRSIAYGRPGRLYRLKDDPEFAAAQELFQAFRRASPMQRSTYIKDLVEQQKERPRILDYFFELWIIALRRDSVQNMEELRRVQHRLFLIKSYTTNKRLQLEALTVNL